MVRSLPKGGGRKVDLSEITNHEIKEVSYENEMSGTGPLAPPWKLLNIPLSALHQEDATQGVVSKAGRSKERQGGNGPGEVEGGRRPGEGTVLGGSKKEEGGKRGRG